MRTMRFILVLFFISNAAAYNLFNIRWADATYRYYINPISVDSSDDYSAYNSTIIGSAAWWDGVGTSIGQTSFQSTTTDQTWSGDDSTNGQNTIIWKESGWGGNVIGVSSIWSRGNLIVEADIKLNTAFAGDSRVNLLVAHEVGHCMGIGHTRESGQDYTAEEYNALMFWQLHTQPDLNCQDNCALTAIYSDGSCDASSDGDRIDCVPCCGGANSAPAVTNHTLDQNPVPAEESLTVTVTATDPEAHAVQVKVDWDDGNQTNYSALDLSGSDFDFAHEYASSGDYTVLARVRDEYGEESSWQSLDTVNVTQAVPVELATFTAAHFENGVQLAWSTASEQMNLGFMLERKTIESNWVIIADYQTHPALRGQGTTARTTHYQFIDANAPANAACQYRLSDINLAGERNICAQLDIAATKAAAQPDEFALLPAYPNPFNAATTIQYQVPRASPVTLTVYSVSGARTARLVNRRNLSTHLERRRSALRRLCDAAPGRPPQGNTASFVDQIKVSIKKAGQTYLFGPP